MPLLPVPTTSQSPTYVPGYVMVQTPYGIVPVPTNTGSPGVPPKDQGGNPNTDSGGGNNPPPPPPPPNTDINKPQSYEFASAIGRMINRNLEPYGQGPAYTLPYGNYGPQFPNLGTQIGSAMYTNVQPRQYTPNWMIDRLPQRLGYQTNGQLDPNSPYITGRKMGNYGQLFQKFGASPQGPFGITPGGDGQQGPFGGGAYQNLTSPFNPYPLNGYDPTTSLNVKSAPNPYLANQQGGTAYGGLGGLLQQRNLAAAAAPPPPGPNVTTKSVQAPGGAGSPGGGYDIQPGSVPGPGGVYIDPTDPNGVINLPQSTGQSSLQSIMSYLQSNPQLRGLLGF
jgi:hypothetical protein